MATEMNKLQLIELLQCEAELSALLETNVIGNTICFDTIIIPKSLYKDFDTIRKAFGGDMYDNDIPVYYLPYQVSWKCLLSLDLESITLRAHSGNFTAECIRKKPTPQ